MSIRELLKSIISCKRIFVFLTALSIVLCSIGLEIKKDNTAEIIIKYICDSAEDGLTENMQNINPYEINSSLVVKNAISQLGLKETNIENICRNITVAPIVPTAEQEKYASWVEQFSDYENNEDEKKHTVYYSVTYTTPEGKDYAKRMLSAIISQYRLFYVEKYTYSNDITKLSGEAALQYDYYETVDMLREKISSNTEYLDNISISDYNYRSPKTGYSLDDLNAEYNSLLEQQLSVAERMIVENGATKNAWYLRNLLQKRATDAQYNIELNNKMADTEKGLMSIYSEKNKAYLWDENDEDDKEKTGENAQVREGVERDEKYTQEKSVYDTLVLNYVNYRTKSVNTEIDKKRYLQTVDFFPGGFSDIQLKAEIEEMLEDTCNTYNDLYELTKETINDYNTYKSAKSIECISGVVAHKATNSTFYYAVSILAALLIGAVISVVSALLAKEEKADEK